MFAFLPTTRSIPVLAAGLLVGGVACSVAPPSPVLAPTDPPKVLFEPYPVEEVSHVADPHEFRGQALCQRCHFPDGRLTAEPNQLCAPCHRFGHGNHPVDVVQVKPVKGLPLLEGGKVACHTCHDPHQKKNVLRKSFNELCTSCHGNHQ